MSSECQEGGAHLQQLYGTPASWQLAGCRLYPRRLCLRAAFPSCLTPPLQRPMPDQWQPQISMATCLNSNRCPWKKRLMWSMRRLAQMKQACRSSCLVLGMRICTMMMLAWRTWDAMAEPCRLVDRASGLTCLQSNFLSQAGSCDQVMQQVPPVGQVTILKQLMIKLQEQNWPDDECLCHGRLQMDHVHFKSDSLLYSSGLQVLPVWVWSRLGGTCCNARPKIAGIDDTFLNNSCAHLEAVRPNSLRAD